MDAMVSYGEKKMKLVFPDGVSFSEYSANPTGEAVGLEQFSEKIQLAEKKLFQLQTADLFIVNDAYRPTPTATILKWIESIGKIGPKAQFIIATGTHQSPSIDQLRHIFGSLYEKLSDRIAVHSAADLDSMNEIGKDSFNQPVLVNNIFCRAKKVVIIGSVEPHYFAGFTGGRKSIFPGLCDYDTTVRNHNLAVSLKSAPMKLDDNPVHEHLNSLMKLIADKEIFSIQTVPGTNCDNSKISLFCGELETSFNEARKLSKKIFGLKTDKQYDLLLAEVHPPLDRNLYQLQKSLENCQPAVKDGGHLMLFSPCREGVGSDKFYRLINHWNPVKDKLPQGREAFGIHKLSRVYQISQRIGINLYSELEKGISDKVFYKSINDPQVFIDNFMEDIINAKVALVHDSGHVAFVS
ncbi:MAG: lactate racemase domain-containing protein [Candidatus Zixiibacteriota bacterium]